MYADFCELFLVELICEGRFPFYFEGILKHHYIMLWFKKYFSLRIILVCYRPLIRGTMFKIIPLFIDILPVVVVHTVFSWTYNPSWSVTPGSNCKENLIYWHTGSHVPPWTDLHGIDSQTGTFTLKQIKAATDDFDSANKIGEGGFGPVYKAI